MDRKEESSTLTVTLTMSREIHLLHIGTCSQWRGGENQVLQLALGVGGKGFRSSVAYPKDSGPLAKFCKHFECIPLEENPLLQYIKERSVHILHAHSSAAHRVALNLKARHPPVKLVVHRRVGSFPGSWNWWSRAKYRSPRVDQYIAVSSYIEKLLKKNSISEEKISLIRDGVPLKTFEGVDRSEAREYWLRKLTLRSQWGPAPVGPVLIGSVAALTREKGHLDFLQAASHLKDLNCHFLIAGEGPLDSLLKRKVRELGLTNQVHFLGFVGEIPKLLGALDITVLASTLEGLGTVLIEATAAGSSVIGTNTGGIPDFVKDRETGLLAPPRNPRALAHCLRQLILSEKWRGALQNRALQWAREGFSAERMCNKTILVYEKLLRGKS